MTYTLTRSKRKTVAIHICDGFVEVRAPLGMPQRTIDEFIALKENWIKKHLTRSSQQLVNRDNFSLNYGDVVYILSTPYIITGSNTKRKKSDLPAFGPNNEFYIPSGLNHDKIKKACIDTYRKTASLLLIPQTLKLADKLQVTPGEIKVTGAKSRWGSCSANKNISYSWRLLMADEDAVDYVIFHELAHIIEMNHSKKFWEIIERYVPDYKECKKRLKALQNKLSNENW